MEKELGQLRLGFLTLYILKYVQQKPLSQMSAFSALIEQEIENTNQLRAGKSLVFKRLTELEKLGYLSYEWGKSPNPRAKKKAKFYSITESGKNLINELETEEMRLMIMLQKLPA
jgi:DNA-binding PadR family transcriptional regulator